MSTPVLDLQGVAFAYPDGHQALHGVDLHVHEGERVALLGPNGAGKTTLVDVITGLTKPTTGELTFAGQRITGAKSHQLVRMGIGFIILTVAMLTAGALEVARRRVLSRHGMFVDADGAEYVPMSIFWQVPQYVVVGAAEVFTFIGQIEFFYDQAPDAMRSVCSGLGSAAFALGNYASSLLVTAVVSTTATNGQPGWIPDDINDGHLDYFFWLLAMLCVGNFGAYLLIARWYNYKNTVY
jgi:dipeptide/tripeptide permease